MPYLMGKLVTYHMNATLPLRRPEHALPHVRHFLEEHKLLTGLMGDLHEEVFLVIKKNGFTYNDIKPTPGSRGKELR